MPTPSRLLLVSAAASSARPGAVAVGRAAARGVEGVVVVVEEVPAGDVVDVAVAARVVVVAVRELGDQVGGVEDPVGLLVSPVDVDARVAAVVADVEGAVAVGVVLVERTRRRPGRPARAGCRRGRSAGTGARRGSARSCSSGRADCQRAPVSRIAIETSGRGRAGRRPSGSKYFQAVSTRTPAIWLQRSAAPVAPSAASFASSPSPSSWPSPPGVRGLQSA